MDCLPDYIDNLLYEQIGIAVHGCRLLCTQVVVQMQYLSGYRGLWLCE